MTQERAASYKARIKAIAAGAAAESAGLKEASALRKVEAARTQRGLAKFAEKRATLEADAEALDEPRAAIRQRLRDRSIESGRVFSGPGGKVAGGFMAIAAALQGFIMGFRGQAGPNPVLQRMDAMIERDIEAQEADYQRLKGELKEVESDYGRIRQEMGDVDEAQSQYRILRYEQAQDKLAQISALTQSKKIMAGAQGMIAELRKKASDEKIRDYQAQQGRKVTTRGGTTTRKPLISVMAPLLRAAQEGKKVEAVSEKQAQKLTNYRTGRQLLSSYVQKHKKQGRAGGSIWWGGKGAALDEERKGLVDQVIATTLPGATVAMVDRVKGRMGTAYTSPKDLKHFSDSLAHEIDILETGHLETEAARGRNVAPFIKLADESRKKYQFNVGK
jgi:hypothetical protein